MVRTKRPAKKSRGESSSHVEPPPEDHPMSQWSMIKEDFNRYQSHFAPRKIIPPSGDEMRVDITHDGRGYSKEIACNMFNIPFDMPKPTVGHLSLEHRLIHYLIVYVMVPRLHNHGLILDEDLEIMWRIVSGHKINWITLIASHTQRNMSGKVTKGLPYAMLWTTIFKYLKVDLNSTRKKELEYNHCIDNHVLNHMKRDIIELKKKKFKKRFIWKKSFKMHHPSNHP
ncbi:hypothetical protein PIB30_109721 [Stylosanthes scabra]|uniref:Uncharacterized protein n=1 Tax=Stylosanthes scabra TaxID=79078 RepID=A0ABU6RZS7_9FABA|nr:hypothetical protein [Stylosanthes scabra]